MRQELVVEPVVDKFSGKHFELGFSERKQCSRGILRMSWHKNIVSADKKKYHNFKSEWMFIARSCSCDNDLKFCIILLCEKGSVDTQVSLYFLLVVCRHQALWNWPLLRSAFKLHENGTMQAKKSAAEKRRLCRCCFFPSVSMHINTRGVNDLFMSYCSSDSHLCCPGLGLQSLREVGSVASRQPKLISWGWK